MNMHFHRPGRCQVFVSEHFLQKTISMNYHNPAVEGASHVATMPFHNQTHPSLSLPDLPPKKRSFLYWDNFHPIPEYMYLHAGNTHPL